MSNTNDGGSFSVDTNNSQLNMDVCQKFTLSMAALPLFLTQIMPALPHINGDWEQTVTFTAGAQESQELAACCIGLSCAPSKEKKFIIAIKIHWITEGGISKEQRHRITKNNTTLRLLLKEIKQGEFTQLKGNVFFAANISLHIQTIAEGKLPATNDALSEWPCALGCPNKSLRDYFAGQALAGLCASQWGGLQKVDTFVERSFEMADAMIAAREVKP